MRPERWQSGFWKSGAVLGLVVAAGVSGCKSNPAANTPAPIVDANGGPDPAAVNNAPVSGQMAGTTYAPTRAADASAGRAPARVLGQQAYGPAPTSSAEQYPEAPQQAGAAYPAGQGQPYATAGEGGAGDYDAAYEQQVDAGQEALYASQPPPPLPVYEQPELTDPGDQWTPGYWSYASQGYYWVPGAWVAPPFIGALWTPGYWGFYGGRYRFNHGFWGRHIGFYGGVPYGFGYTGNGYEGGYWNGNHFFYNNAVNRVNVNVVHNVYVRNVTVVNNNRVSYNGPGGWNARPTASDVAVLHEQRVPAMQVQRQRAQEAASNRQQFVAENHGHPAVAVLATRQPADRVAPAALAPVGRPGGVEHPAPAGGFGAANGARPSQGQEQGRGQAGFAARGTVPPGTPGSNGRPGQPEPIRPGGQTQPSGQTQGFRAQPEGQPRPAPEAPRPVQNQPRTPAPEGQRPDQQRQFPQAQRPGPVTRPEPQAQPAPSAPRPQVQPQVRPQPEAAPHPQPQAAPHPQPQAAPHPQPQAAPHPQPQAAPHPQPQAAPHPQPQAHPQPQPRPAPASHPEESHPHG